MVRPGQQGPSQPSTNSLARRVLENGLHVSCGLGGQRHIWHTYMECLGYVLVGKLIRRPHSSRPTHRDVEEDFDDPNSAENRSFGRSPMSSERPSDLQRSRGLSFSDWKNAVLSGLSLPVFIIESY